MTGNEVKLEIGRDGCYPSGSGYQVGIFTLSPNGSGHGYRLCGPDYCSLGNQEKVASVTVKQRDAREMFSHIRPLLGEEWLIEKVKEGKG